MSNDTKTIHKNKEEQLLAEIKENVLKEKKQVDPSNLSEDQLKKVDELKQSVDIDNSNSILQYGVAAQKDLSDFASGLLKKVKTKDTGQVGEILTGLSTEVKKVDIDSFLSHKSSFLSSLPGIGRFFNELEKFKSKYQSIEENINKIVDRLEKEYEVMLRDVVIFDELYKENLKYYDMLDLLIYAGEDKIDDLEKVLHEKELEYDNSKDDLLFQEIENLRNFINQFEVRLHDLKLTRISTIQSFPQINMIKSGDQALAGKIQSAILNTIPLWKRHITVAIGLYNQKNVAEHLTKVDDTTDQLLKENSELLKESSSTVAKTLQRGIISIETLQTVHNNLIESIDGVRKIVEDGRKERVDASTKMEQLEQELKDKLANVKDQSKLT